jgi:hypothetical protein
MEEDDHGHHPLLLRTRRPDPSSLEDDGIGHGHSAQLFTEERRKVAMVILLFSRMRKSRTPSLRRYAMTT